MIIFGFHNAMWKNKFTFDDLEIYEDVSLNITKKVCSIDYTKKYNWEKCNCNINDKKYHELLNIKIKNLKVFDFKEENRYLIINYLKNKGFKYIFTPNLQDRLIFEYKVCLFE